MGRIQMDKAELFTDGKAYERMMGRWSRLVGQTFLAWLDLPQAFDGSMWAVATASLQRKLLLAVPLPP
jgi:hypothetical protein